MPKKYGYLLDKIATINNVELADDNAMSGKSNIGIKIHNKHREEDNKKLLNSFINLTYTTSAYSTYKLYEPKERIIFRLPYYPDRIAHHAIMNIMEPIWVAHMINDTYACVKKRGIHAIVRKLQKILNKDANGTAYCLKLDIHKFYPSIDHDILKIILRKKIKDKKLLFILDGIIDSADGVPIGNYLSQFFANLYLTEFDHFIKEVLKIKYYFRYCDDIVILCNRKEKLWKWFALIKEYFEDVLKLSLKSNWQVFPVESRGIDFVGYKFFHSHILLRKSIKLRIKKLIDKYIEGVITKTEFKASMNSYVGWLKHCNSHNFLYRVKCITGVHFSAWNGELELISKFYNKNVKVIEYEVRKKYFEIHFIYKSKSYKSRSKSIRLLNYLKKKSMPLNIVLKKNKYEKSKKNTEF